MFKIILIFSISITIVLGGVLNFPNNNNKKNPYSSDDDLRDQRMHPGDQLLQSAPATNIPNSKQNQLEQTEFWLNNAKEFVAKNVNKQANKKIAKNIIMFLGDGMSTATLAATRPYINDLDTNLSFEEFPTVGMAKTYCVNYQVADSACTSTAYLSGVKANYGTIGVSGKVPRYHCTAQLDESTHTSSIAEWAMAAGKWAGFVTTSEVTDASPAGLYAHSSNRYYENDVEILSRGCDPNVIDDIARQLVLNDKVGGNLRVIMGGGRREFRNTTIRDEENSRGYRSDGRDLIAEWIEKKKELRAKYVWNATELLNVNAAETDYLLGLFEASDMRYHLEVEEENLEDAEPTLSQMTEKAIDILSKNENGFFLFVEGGRIDSAHHGTYAKIALDETAEFSKAVALAKSKLNDEDTLIVVTADHSHTLSYSGYPYRGSDILKTAGLTSSDNLPYSVLMYANGQGYYNNVNNSTGERYNLTEIDMSPARFRYPTTLPLSSETHAGDDVAVFATGPWSHLFTGTYEQNLIPHMMAYASCIGTSQTACGKK